MEKAIFKIKPKMKEQIRKIIKFNELAERVGVGRCYISEVMNGRKTTKLLAYSICKAVSPNIEIADLFDRVNEK